MGLSDEESKQIPADMRRSRRVVRRSSLSLRAFQVRNVPTSWHRDERRSEKSCKYTPLHLEFVSNHTCTHIALRYGECEEITFKEGVTHQDIFGRKERLSAKACYSFLFEKRALVTHRKVIEKKLHWDLLCRIKTRWRRLEQGDRLA